MNQSQWFILTSKKTFDSVSHNRLLKVLIQYGFDNSLVNCLNEFLNIRSQRVLINNTLSDPLKIHSGIPQGGAIGPLLF